MTVAAAAGRPGGRATPRWPRTAPGQNNYRADPSGRLTQLPRGFGSGAIIDRLVAVDFDHRSRIDPFDVLRHQPDVVGRRALVAIAVDRRTIEQRADLA